MSVSPPGPETRIYQPDELNREVRLHLEAGFPRLWLAGEISNLARPASGHLYFTLKDSRAQIRCALFRGQHGNVGARPENGDQVLVRGRLSLYEPRGDYQLIADAMLPAGSGALQQAFEALKKKLEAKGLFAAERKRALPRYPACIGVITSTSGAAIRDIQTTLARRWPAARIRIHAAPVQGEQAVPGLLAALDRVEREAMAEVVILARGGGSLEDLRAFNDERLARRIAAFTIPLVSGVGHETDFTISDFVADLRAATPTAAAEAVTPDGPALLGQIRNLEQRLTRAWTRVLQRGWQQVDQLDRRLNAHQPQRRLDAAAQALAGFRRRCRRAIEATLQVRLQRHRALERRLATQNPHRFITHLRQQSEALRQRLLRANTLQQERKRQRLATAARALDSVSPLAILGRGYALIEDDRGRLLSRRKDFSPGQTIHTRVRDLRISSKVVEVQELEPERRNPE